MTLASIVLDQLHGISEKDMTTAELKILEAAKKQREKEAAEEINQKLLGSSSVKEVISKALKETGWLKCEKCGYETRIPTDWFQGTPVCPDCDIDMEILFLS